MPSPPTFRPDFDARWRALGLSQVDGIAHGETLTPRTLATMRASRAEMPGNDAPHVPDYTGLPRISLGDSPVPNKGGLRPLAQGRSDLEIRALIGEGAMGRIHVAHQHSLQRDVAIKTLKPRHRQDDRVRALLQEAVITGGLEHPGIVPVHVLGIDDAGSPILVMKRIEGVDWGHLLCAPEHAIWRSRASDRLVANLEILMQVCQAVHFAHSRGILHRDIKPDNVMIGEFGEVYLVDWGVALRLEHAANTDLDIVGTPAYMAPEMVAGGPLDARTDVYLLGATLHEVLTGQSRHQGTTLHEVLANAHAGEPYVYDASVPPALAELCNRATHVDPCVRPQSAGAFRAALVEFLQHRGSIEIADEALLRLAELQVLLADAGEQPPADLRRAYDLASQARFGLTLALRNWTENPKAREGLHAAIVAAVEIELRQGHVGAAEALLAEVCEPPLELRQRLEALARQQDEARAEHERLQRLAHDLDVRVSGRERTRAFAVVAAVGILLSIWVAMRNDPEALSPTTLLAMAFVTLATSTVVVVAARRFLFRNALNRRLSLAFLVVFAVLTLSRSVGVFLEMPTVQILIQDFLILSAMMTLASITLLRRFWILAALYVSGLVISLAHRELTVDTFSFVAVISVPTIILVLSRHMRDQDVRAPSS